MSWSLGGKKRQNDSGRSQPQCKRLPLPVENRDCTQNPRLAAKKRRKLALTPVNISYQFLPFGRTGDGEEGQSTLLHPRVLRLGFLQDGDIGIVSLIRFSRSAKRESERILSNSGSFLNALQISVSQLIGFS